MTTSSKCKSIITEGEGGRVRKDEEGGGEAAPLDSLYMSWVICKQYDKMRDT